jgi:hypothetical protein
MFEEEETTNFDNSILINRLLCLYWEANSGSASQEISSFLWNPEIHYRVHNSPLLVPFLSQMNPVLTPNTIFLFNNSHLTSWSRINPDKPTLAQLVKKFLAFSATRLHKSPLIVPIPSQYNPVHVLTFYFSLISILILFSHLTNSIYQAPS